MHLDIALPKRHLNNYLALNTLKYKLFKRHLNILLSWVHNYMKTPKTIANTNQLQLGKIYSPSCQKGQKSWLCHTFFIYKKNIFPLFNYRK